MIGNHGKLGIIFILSVIFLISCGPPAKIGDESQGCQPRDLVLDTVGNGRAIVAYNPGCSSTRILRGFNFYVSPKPITGQYPGRDLPSTIIPHNPEVYPGDPEGTPVRETFEIKNVPNATRFFVHMRAVYPDGSFSLPTNEIELVCYPQGEIQLATSYSGDKDGFSFAKDDYCDTDDLENDIYFYNRKGEDYICSPSRLGPVNRETKIYMVAAGIVGGGLDKYKPMGPYYERMKLRGGLRMILETADGHQAAVYIKGIEGEEDNRKVIFDYLYKPPVKEVDSET